VWDLGVGPGCGIGHISTGNGWVQDASQINLSYC